MPRRLGVSLSLLVAAAALVGCPSGGGGIGGVLVVANVDVQPGNSDLTVGTTKQLSATPKTSSGIVITGRSVTWSTDNPNVATVSTSGLVTGVTVGGPVRIRATVDGVSGDGIITVRAVPVDHVTVDPPEAGILVNGNLPLIAKALDANGNELSGRSFAWNSSNSSIAAVTSTGVVIGVTEGGPVTISATAENKTGTSLISVSTRPATRLGFLQQPGLTTAGQPMVPAIRVALQDDFLTTVLGATNQVTIQLAGNPGGATLSGTKTRAAVNGVATFNDLSLDRVASSYTFLVTSPGLTSATSNPFDVIAGAAGQLAFTTPPPSSAQSGIVLAPQPVLQLKDGSGNNVAQAGLVITASIGSGPAGASLGGTLTATTNASGSASFGNLSISGTVGSYTLAFAANGVTTLTSGTIALGAGLASRLFLATQPSSGAQSGAPLSVQPAVQLRDASGNNVAQGGVVITASIASGGGLLGGATTATTNGSGLATFTSLAINGPAGQYTLGFAATGLAGTTSGTITLGAGAPTQLAITTQPSNAAQSGVPLSQQPAVQLRDASNNPVATSGVLITATVSSGSISGTVTKATDAGGTATFSDLAISGPAGTYTITFIASGLTSVTSSNITLGAGAATKLTIATQPSSSAQSGVAFSQQPAIQLTDAANNPVAQSGVVITASIATGGGTLGGTLTATTNGSGVATFSNLSITGTAGVRTLGFAATGLTGVTSGNVSIGAGAATQLSITTQPSSSVQSGVAFAQQPGVQLLDAANNPVAQSGVVITATIATGGGTLGGTLTATTNAGGLATFSNLQISGTIGVRTLSFAAAGLTSATSNNVSVTAGPASQLTITTQPSSNAQSGVAFAQQPALQLRDAAGNAVSQSGVVVTATIATGGGTLGGTTTATTNASGVATFTNLSITGTAGDRTLSFSAASLTGVTSGVITVTAGAGSQLSITTQPSASAQSGVAFGQQPVIQLLDASLNPVSQAGVVVTAAISTGGGTLGGTLTATTNASGIATFTNLSITGTIGGRTLIFSASGFSSVTSASINLTAGAASQLTITTQPSASAQSGVAFAQQPAIQLRDASGNSVSQSGVVITVALASGGGTLGGTLTASTNASGLATFSNLQISGTVGARTLSFTSGSLTGVTSSSINVTAGPASQLTITTQPSSTAQSGVSFPQQPVLQLRDASGNAVSQSGVVVTAAIASGGGSLGGTVTATTDASGVAAFVSLSISGTVGNRTLGFSATGLTGATSATIALVAGPASQLSITTQPSSSAQSGIAFTQQPVLQLRDAAGNAVSQSGVSVSVTIASGGGVLGGTTSVSTNASGVATFTNLSITGTAGDRTLSFTSTGLTGITSGIITVTAGPASQLSITTQPSSSVQNAVSFGQQPVIQLKDAVGNNVNTSGIVVTAAISTGGGSLGGTLTATTNASGVATFTNLSITGTIGDRTLVFTASGFTSVTSNTITVTAGSATQLAITTQPSSSAQSGIAFGQQPVIQLRDVSANNVSQSGVVVTAAIASGGGTLSGTLTATTNASGVATFTNLSISGTVGNRTLSFSATGLTAATSNTIALTAGNADHLSITQQPSSSAQSGVQFGQQPVIQLRDVSNNAVSQAGVAITATIASGPGGATLGGATVVTTDASGVATYVSLSLSGTSGSYTIGFAGTGLTGATSSSITVSAGTATKLAITTQPSSSAQSGVVFAQQPAIQLQDNAGNPVSQSGVVVSATINSGGGSLGGTTTATTNASGLATFTNLSITGTAGDRTLLFAAAGLVSVASNTITVTAGPATQLLITQQPVGGASGGALGTQPIVAIRDASGNTVTTDNTTQVTVAIFSGAGGSLGGTLTKTALNGVATFTNLTLSGTVGTNYVLQFTSSPALTAANSNNVTVTVGTATKLAITTQPVGGASGAALATQPVIVVQDAQGNTRTADNTTQVTIAIASGAGGTLGGTQTVTAASGVATFTNVTLAGTVGVNYTLQFTSSPVLTAATSGNVTVTVGAANKLGITTQPVGGASGAALATQPVVAVQDAQGNTRTADNSTQVTVAIFSGAGGTLGGTLTVTAVNGVATFTNVTLSGTVGTNYVLRFTSSPVLTAANSNNVTVTAGGATQLVITTQPVGGASGAALGTQPIVAVRDAGNNTVTTDNTTQVTVAIFSGAGGTLGGTQTVTAVNGVATFTNVTLAGTVGTNYVLRFTSSPVLTAANSNNVTVTVGAANKLGITTQPVGGASGAVLATQPVVAVQDAQGNTRTADNSTQVTVAIFSGAGGTLGGTQTVTAVNGIATFTNVTLSGTVSTNYVLQFTSNPVLTAANSNNVTVTPGAANKIGITTQPVGGNSGAALATQPVVVIQDAQGNTVTSDNSTQVTVAIFSGAGGSLGGTLTVTAVNGIATFTNVTLSGTAGTNYVLRFTSAPALTPINSNNVQVSSGGATQLAITTQPVGGASGAVLPTQPVVAIKDASNNTVTTDNATQVTVAIFSGVGGTLGGTQTVTAVNGVATFTNLTLAGTVGTNYVLRFTSSPVLTAANSNNVTVSVGAANKLGITTQPVGGASGALLATQPVVAVQDAQGNTRTADNTTQVTVAIASGAGGTLGGTQTVTAVNGVATFTNLTLAGTVGVNYTLQFTSSPVLTAATSGNVTVTVGAANKLGITTQPVGGASGAALATQPVIAVQDAQGNTRTADNTTQVTVAIFSGAGGTLGGTLTVTAVNGIATFTNVTLTGTAGTNYVLQFTSSPALTAANSNNVQVSSGGATQLAITTQPVGAASGAALATQPIVAIKDGSSNTVTTDNTTQVTVAIFSGAGGTLGGTQTVTSVNGVATFTNLTLAGTVGTNYVLRFTSSPVLTAVNSTNVTVTVGAANKLGITTQPVGGASGAVLATQPVVAVQDAQGNTRTADNSTQVTVAIFSGAGGTLGGTQTVTAVNGVATFTNVTLAGTVGTNYVLQFTSSPVLTAANSSNVTVTVGGANKLGITTQPVGGASGALLTTQPVIAVQDAQGNTRTADNATQVTVAIFSGAGGTLGGTQTVTAVSGVATFTNLTLTGTAGTNYVLQFTSSPVLTAVNSNNVQVSSGGATQLAISTQPAGGASGAALATQPVIAIKDASNNTVTTDNTTQVTVAIFSGAGGTLGGTLTKTAVNGVASFTNVTLSGTVGTNYVLQFSSSPVLTTANSNNVTVTVGAANKLGITTQPVGGASGAVLATQPVVAVQDAQGNTRTADNTTQVTVAIFSGAGGTLGGTQTVTAVNGIATFTNVTLAGTVGTNYVLQFTSSPVLTAANSGNVTVSVGAANKLGITTQPVGGASGAALATQPVIAVQDAQGNTRTADNATQVTVAIFSGAGGTLGGTQTVTAVNGIATFTNVTLAGTVGTNYVLQFTSSPLLTAANSANVTVTPGAATKLTITTQPVGPATNGGQLATQPVIAIQDAQGNTVTSDNATQVSVAIHSGLAGSLGGTQTVTAVAGVATFTNLTLSGLSGTNYVLRFTSVPVLTFADSNNVTVP